MRSWGRNNLKTTTASPEYRALLLALRLQDGRDAGAALRDALAQVTDRGGLLRMALRHKVFPSLFRRVADACPDAVPPEFLADLKQLHRALIRHNLRLTGALFKILQLFASHNIQAVPYKGPVLAAVAYGDIALRQFDDLDILVPKRDLNLVRELLTREGYSLCCDLTPQQERFHLRYTCELTFQHPQKPLLDIHWRLAADYLGGGPDPDLMLQRGVPVLLEGKPVSSLAPEDMLLMLCLNGAFHLWNTLGSVLDVAGLVKSQSRWDWPDLIRRAGNLGMRRMLLLGLYLAQEMLGAPVPPEIIREADADPAVVALRRWVPRNMWMRSGKDLGFLEQTFFYLQTRDCFKDKLRHVWFRLSIPTVEDWRWVPLPDSLYGLYYVIRPLRLGWQGLVRPLMRRLGGLLSHRGVRRGLEASSL